MYCYRNWQENDNTLPLKPKEPVYNTDPKNSSYHILHVIIKIKESVLYLAPSILKGNVLLSAYGKPAFLFLSWQPPLQWGLLFALIRADYIRA